MITLIVVFAGVKFTFGGISEEETCVYYEEVEIVKGDTLWSISEEYKSDDESIMECVEKIKSFNNMKSDKIKSGQRIIIPVSY